MATYERTWNELIGLIGAMAGVNVSSRPEEIDHVKSLVNLAASQARKSTDYWERSLVIGEPRTVSRGYVAASEDSFHAYGAGTSDVNGLFQRNGTANTKARYSLYQSDGTSIDWDLEYDGSANWEILVGADHGSLTADTVYYRVASTADLPPTTGWTTITGTTTAPALVDVADVDTFIYWQRDDPVARESRTFEFQASSGGVRPWGNRDTNGVVYCTYIKRNSDVYGDGTGGTTSSIPDEIFEYLALYTSRMLQIAKGTANGSPYAAIASREVETALENAHMRLEASGIPQTVRQNVETRIAYSSIL